MGVSECAHPVVCDWRHQPHEYRRRFGRRGEADLRGVRYFERARHCCGVPGIQGSASLTCTLHRRSRQTVRHRSRAVILQFPSARPLRTTTASEYSATVGHTWRGIP
jgi:hypothetical protein